MARLYNCTDGPVSLADGTVIGGREHAETQLSADVRGHVKAGRLVQVKDADVAKAAPKTTEEK